VIVQRVYSIGGTEVALKGKTNKWMNVCCLKISSVKRFKSLWRKSTMGLRCKCVWIVVKNLAKRNSVLTIPHKDKFNLSHQDIFIYFIIYSNKHSQRCNMALSMLWNIYQVIITSFNLGRFSLRKWDRLEKAQESARGFCHFIGPLILKMYTKWSNLYAD
jgi:hypothetical protein